RSDLGDDPPDAARVGLDHPEQGDAAGVGPAAALLPVAHRAQLEPESLGESGLRHPVGFTDRFHIYRRLAAAARVTAGISDRVLEPGGDLVECALHLI